MFDGGQPFLLLMIQGAMSDDLLKIAGGTIYDPANDIDGQVGDIWVSGGRIVPPPTDAETRPTRTIDAAGLVVMPGGIDMHCHIAGPKVNVARKMRPEEKRKAELIERTSVTHSGTMGSVPSTFATGYKYAGLGYTTAFDAAIPPLAARHAHEEFEDTPCIDKGFYVLMGNNHYVMRAIHEGEPERLKAFVAWLLGAAKGFAAKLVNPGGVEVWKHHQAGNVHGLDEAVDHFDVTPRQILREMARTVDELALPHSVHVHANNLGMPGNWTTTLETMKALEGHRGHMTHIQFHSYGGGDADEDTFNSKVTELAEYVNSHPNVTIDVGQVLFGETTSMTGDGPLGYFLSNIYGGKWFSGDTEMESGCGITPIKYKNPFAGACFAVGDRPGVVSASRRPVASGDEHRSSQRRFVPGLSADRASVDGPHLSSGRAQDLPPTGPRAVDVGRPRSGILAQRNRHHHPGGPGPDSRPDAEGPLGRGSRRRHHDLHTRREQGTDVRSAADGDQGGRSDRRKRRHPQHTDRRHAPRGSRLRPRHRNRHRRLVRTVLFHPLPQLPGRPQLSARGESGGKQGIAGVRRTSLSVACFDDLVSPSCGRISSGVWLW